MGRGVLGRCVSEMGLTLWANISFWYVRGWRCGRGFIQGVLPLRVCCTCDLSSIICIYLRCVEEW